MPGEAVTRSPFSDMLDAGTVGNEIVPPDQVSATRTAAKLLTEDIGFSREQARVLNQKYGDLHQRSHFVEWRAMTADRGKASITEMLAELADLGFAWRDIARLVGVTVAAVQKWRRGEGATGESRRRVASLLAACDLIAEHYEVREIASWFEMPLVGEAPVTPIDLYVEERVDLVFDYASGHADPEQILSDFDPRWRERYRSDFEVFRAADGQLSIRPKAE
jgi:transcriptional regulator with XRE-family HTH domain